MRLERGLKWRNELLKLVERETGHIQEFRGVGLHVDEPYTGHTRCLLSWEAQYTINRDNLKSLSSPFYPTFSLTNLFLTVYSKHRAPSPRDATKCSAVQ